MGIGNNNNYLYLSLVCNQRGGSFCSHAVKGWGFQQQMKLLAVNGRGYYIKEGGGKGVGLCVAEDGGDGVGVQDVGRG